MKTKDGRILNVMTRQDFNSGEKCSGCNHAFSNHYWVVPNSGSRPCLQLYSCRICNCKECHI